MEINGILHMHIVCRLCQTNLTSTFNKRFFKRQKYRIYLAFWKLSLKKKRKKKQETFTISQGKLLAKMKRIGIKTRQNWVAGKIRIDLSE